MNTLTLHLDPRPRCAKHRTEWDAWLMPSPQTFSALAGRSGTHFIHNGPPETVESYARERRSLYDHARSRQRAQLNAISEMCAGGRGCSSDARDAFTAGRPEYVQGLLELDVA